MTGFGYPWIEEEMIAAHAKKAGKFPKYPADHKVGMGVPEGGSNCDKCEYLKAAQTCGQAQFIKWNGSNTIPEPTSRYCCDFFEAE